MTKQEKFDKALEWLENASYNCDNVAKIGIAIVPMIKNQIDNALKYLRNEEVDEDVFGGKQ
jgi:predicted negative regulator of RcsB-dependent stress response